MRVTDPVCEMTIDSETTAGREIWHGQTYYFCCKLCQHKFRATLTGASERLNTAGGERRRQDRLDL